MVDQPPRYQVHDVAFLLQDAFHAEQAEPSNSRRCRSAKRFQTMTLVQPVSSSRVTKIVPLAVCGRCRPVTMPMARAGAPARSCSGRLQWRSACAAGVAAAAPADAGPASGAGWRSPPEVLPSVGAGRPGGDSSTGAPCRMPGGLSPAASQWALRRCPASGARAPAAAMMRKSFRVRAARRARSSTLSKGRSLRAAMMRFVFSPDAPLARVLHMGSDGTHLRPPPSIRIRPNRECPRPSHIRAR